MKRLFVMTGLGILGIVAVKVVVFDSLTRRVSGGAQQSQGAALAQSQGRGTIDDIILRKKCNQQQLDDIGRDGPDRRTDEERKADLSACEPFTP